VKESDRLLFAFTIALQPAKRAWVQAVGTVLTNDNVPMSLALVIILTFRMGAAAHQRALAAEIGINPAALVRVLDQGETAGLLKRCEVPDNRRVKTVALLPAGKALAKKMEESLAALRAQILRDVPARDIETATRVLRALESESLAYTAQASEPASRPKTPSVKNNPRAAKRQ
jgi:MarR family transcriptional regulator for hemolysin